MEIHYFFRSKNLGRFSIEQVFEPIAEAVAEQNKVEWVEVPQVTKGLLSLIRNGFYARARQGMVNHITGDVNYLSLFFSRNRFNILTIHDLGLLKQVPRESIKGWIYRKLWFEWPLKKIDIVTVISQKTKRDLISCFPEVSPKVRIVPNYVDPQIKNTEKAFNKLQPRLLFIGTAPHKNLERLIRAIQGLNVQLNIIGSVSSEVLSSIQEQKINFILEKNLSRKELINRYYSCDIVVFPSLHEGFGLPVLEGQASGRVVLSSNISPIKEISGGGAFLVDPYNIESIREGIIRIINDDSLKSDLINKGRINVEKYTFSKVIEEYYSVYSESKIQDNSLN